jgi:Protein of unknown function (DUF2490)
MKQIFIFFLITPFFLFAQPAETGNWFIYLGDKKIDPKWNWHHEVQYRNFNFLGDTEQLLVRTGLGYNLKENNNNVHLGYAFIYSEPYIANTNDKTSTKENRIYQQFITRQAFGRVAVQHRYRFEQRFIEDDFKLRLRYFLALNIALNKKQMTDKTLYLVAYNEIFVNTEQVFFDRNRLYGGIGYRFSKHIRTELGFLNQYTNTVSRNQFNWIAFINL